jgi:phytoene dehydrogenase-like protein
MGDPDIVVIGSGPNGLVAAARLARAGRTVLVLEAHPGRAGGAVGSDEGTRPGFVHDVGAGFFPLARVSPAFGELPLEQHGLRWLNAPVESCFPALDGSSASIVRLAALTEGDGGYFGTPADTRAWEALARRHASYEDRLFRALLGPLPSRRALLALGPGRLLRLARWFASSGRGLSRRWFRSEAARRVLPALALHGDQGPEDFASAAMGYVLALSATSVGYAVPEGGAQRITDALVALLRQSSGHLRLGARVSQVLVRQGQAVAVRLASGEEIAARQAVLADTAPGPLFLDLLAEAPVPSCAWRAARRFRHGWGTFKMDWALGGPVPWRDARARASATVHLAEDTDDLVRFTRQVRAGQLPERPYLVVGQQSVVDPTRAPAGAHTLYAYTHVPSRLAGGWDAHSERFADAVEARIESLAPGFRAAILARRILHPALLESANENLVGGDLGGGSGTWRQQLFFRPFFPSFRYRMPIGRLYLCSSSTHPGPGVHGMCGWNAAGRVLADVNPPVGRGRAAPAPPAPAG